MPCACVEARLERGGAEIMVADTEGARRWNSWVAYRRQPGVDRAARQCRG